MTRQKGVALLVVLMILAIMAALASEMTVRYQINLKRTSYTRMRLQQNWLAELAEMPDLTYRRAEFLKQAQADITTAPREAARLRASEPTRKEIEG